MLLDLETDWGLPTPTLSRVHAEMIFHNTEGFFQWTEGFQISKCSGKSPDEIRDQGIAGHPWLRKIQGCDATGVNWTSPSRAGSDSPQSELPGAMIKRAQVFLAKDAECIRNDKTQTEIPYVVFVSDVCWMILAMLGTYPMESVGHPC